LTRRDKDGHGNFGGMPRGLDFAMDDVHFSDREIEGDDRDNATSPIPRLARRPERWRQAPPSDAGATCA